MKLCKDCKHAWMPYAGINGSGAYALPTCIHSDAPREPVYGASIVMCFEARGTEGICGPDGDLFEDRPVYTVEVPEPIASPQIVGAIRDMTREEMAKMYPPRKSWIARIFGG